MVGYLANVYTGTRKLYGWRRGAELYGQRRGGQNYMGGEGGGGGAQLFIV